MPHHTVLSTRPRFPSQECPLPLLQTDGLKVNLYLENYFEIIRSSRRNETSLVLFLGLIRLLHPPLCPFRPCKHIKNDRNVTHLCGAVARETKPTGRQILPPLTHTWGGGTVGVWGGPWRLPLEVAGSQWKKGRKGATLPHRAGAGTHTGAGPPAGPLMPGI